MDDSGKDRPKSPEQEGEELAAEALKRHLAFSDYKARETYRCLLEWSNEQARRFDHWLLWLDSGGIVVSLYVLKEIATSRKESAGSCWILVLGIVLFLASIVIALSNLLHAHMVLQDDAQDEAERYETFLELIRSNRGGEIRMPGEETKEDKRTQWLNRVCLARIVLGALVLTCSILLCVGSSHV